MCSSKPPAPQMPDYGAQTRSNIESAKATSIINNPDQINPYGSTRYTSGDVFDQAGYDSALSAYNNQPTETSQIIGHGQNGQPIYGMRANPNRGTAPDRGNYTKLGRDTITQTLSPEEQKIFNANQQNRLGLNNLANTGIDRAQGIIGEAIDYSGAPAAPGSSDEVRKKVIDAMMNRSGSALDRANSQQDSDLIAAGIRPGTEAWDRVKGEQGRNRNDMLSQAELAGGNAAVQDFGMQSDARRNYITELLSKRSVPLNEITALMSGSQTQNPFAGQGNQGGAQVSPVDMNAGNNMLNQYNMNAYNQEQARNNALIGGAFSLASRSDRRLKTDIQRIGTHKLGIGIYSWKYIDYIPDGLKEFAEKGKHAIGVMADEVRKVMPNAVVNTDGYDSVYYSMLGD